MKVSARGKLPAGKGTLAGIGPQRWREGFGVGLDSGAQGPRLAGCLGQRSGRRGGTRRSCWPKDVMKQPPHEGATKNAHRQPTEQTRRPRSSSFKNVVRRAFTYVTQHASSWGSHSRYVSSVSGEVAGGIGGLLGGAGPPIPSSPNALPLPEQNACASGPSWGLGQPLLERV